MALMMIIFPGRDPSAFTLFENGVTPASFSVLTVEASDLDGDTLAYSLAPPDVSRDCHVERCLL